ncbi:short chain dehydrogenase [uncultured Shewanella sp.]|uniref:short chain dehydrogenase n=1 Tax=uncultured Shewanella sp. TaxID=173975 RepID=UPI0026207C0B|nr:short chain dehydrogenase [uncultured Shewanella sp.]
MKMLIIGASGTIGSQITAALSNQHDVITAGKHTGARQIDITDPESIHTTLTAIGQLDAIINATGDVAFDSFENLSQKEWNKGIQSRLMGQINLTQMGMHFLNDGGSITLTTGIIADHPIKYGVSAATLNGAIHHFVKAVSNELPRGIRINAVSPSVVTESLSIYADYFPGFQSIDASTLAQFYLRSTLGIETGQVFKAYGEN